MWEVSTDQFDLLVQGLKSCNNSKKGKIKILDIKDAGLLTLDQLILNVFIESIYFRNVTFSANSVAIIQQYISSNGSLKSLTVHVAKHVELLLPIFFKPSSLESISYIGSEPFIDNHTIMNLLVSNSNIKRLDLLLFLKLPTSTLCDNASLRYLANHIRFFGIFPSSGIAPNRK